MAPFLWNHSTNSSRSIRWGSISSFQRQRTEDRFAKAIQQRKLLYREVLQLASFFIVYRGLRLSGSVDQVVAQRVEAVAVKLDIEALFGR